MADAQYNFSGIPDAPAGGYNFSGIPDKPDIVAHADIPTREQIAAAEKNPTATNTLAWYNDPTAGAYHKLMDSVVEHLPMILGAGGGVVGSAGGPVGAVGLAGLGGAAGEAYKELINRARGKAAPNTSSDAALKIAAQTAIQGGSQAVGEAAGPLMTKLGERVMQSAVKPGLKVLLRGARDGETPQVVKTLLDEGINVTPGGLNRLQDLIGSTNDQIAEALAPVAQKQVSALGTTSRLTPLAKRFTQQVNPQPDLAAISDVGQNFLEHPAITAAGTMSVADAQALKQGTYRLIGKKYGTVAPAAIEAEKALARGLKEQIAAEVPEVSALNAREGKLLEVLDSLGRRVALNGNKDPIGFAWVAHSPLTFTAALIDRNPAVKSLLARGLYNAAGSAAKVSPQLIRVAMASLASEDPNAGLGASSTDRGNPR